MGLSGIAYVNADHEELFFDSTDLILRNPQVADLEGALGRLWRSPLAADEQVAPGNHRGTEAQRSSALAADEQIAHVSFALNYTVNRALGADPFDVTGFLIFNVAVHALNAVLVYLLVRVLLQFAGAGRREAIGVALVAAAWFAVHPIQATSVAYIAQRRGAMATTFYLLGMLAFLKARGGPRREGLRGQGAAERGWTPGRVLLVAAIPVCYWASVRSKSVGLTLPAMMLAVECCLRAGDRRALGRFFKWAVPAAAALGAVGVAFLWNAGVVDLRTMEVRSYSATELWGMGTQFLTSARVFVHYWKLLLLPLPAWSSVDHVFPISNGLVEHGAALALVFHAAILGFAVVAVWRGWLLISAGLAWFYIALCPYAIVPQANVFVEYKTYLASVGAAMVAAEIARRLGARLGRPIAPALATAIVAALLAVTIYRNQVYQRPANVWKDVLAKYPGHLRGNVGMGIALRGEGKIKEAMAHFQAAIGTKPDFAEAHFDLADLYATQKDTEAAISHYRLAVRHKPEYPEAHYNLANLLSGAGRSDEAIEHYEAAIRARPNYAFAHNNLANLLTKLLRTPEAIRHCELAVQSDPNLLAARVNLANALRAEGRRDEAITHFKKALEIDPRKVSALINLGNALREKGELNEAREHYRRALEIEPENASLRELLRETEAKP